jgi:RNA polymerase sigma-70 factor (ECF subfamily)
MRPEREKNDEVLARRAMQGDPEAISALVERYSAPLYRFIQRARPHHDDCDDLLQETWISVWTHLPRFDPRRRFSTWLFQIALNHCRDHARRDRVRNRFQAEAGRVSDPDPEASPEEKTESRRVMVAIEDLPARQKEVLLLRYYQGFSEKETAEILDCPPGTVKSRLHQATRQIRRVLRR